MGGGIEKGEIKVSSLMGNAEISNRPRPNKVHQGGRKGTGCLTKERTSNIYIVREGWLQEKVVLGFKKSPSGLSSEDGG